MLSRLYLTVLVFFCFLNTKKVFSYEDFNISNQSSDICDKITFGSQKIIKGNKAYTSYKNVLKNLQLAEKHYETGLIENASNNIKTILKNNDLTALKRY